MTPPPPPSSLLTPPADPADPFVGHAATGDPFDRVGGFGGFDPLDPLAGALGLVESVAGEDPGSVPDVVLAERIEALSGLAERVEATLVRTISAWDARLAWKADAALAPVPWLRRHTGTDDKTARRRVRCGRLLAEHPTLDAALAAAEITTSHVAVLARFATRERRALFTRDLAVLIDAARLLDPDDLRAAAERWAAYADDELDRPPRSLRDHLDRRRLHLRPLDNGMVAVDGLLPAAAAAIVAAALDHLDHPDPTTTPDGPRTPAQRAADNLVELARRALTRPDGSHDPDTTLLVHIDADVYEGTPDPAHAATRPHATCGPTTGTPLAPETLRRFGCTSWISAIVFDADHEILHLGRRRRLFSPAQRRALTARDHGCVFPGCDRPAPWCRTHHLDPWGPPSHGPTDIDNGCLLCDRHHTLVHEGGWRIHHEPDGGWTAYDHTGRPRAATDHHKRDRPPPLHPPPHPRPNRRPTPPLRR